MTAWEIGRANAESLLVELPASRNLVDEFEQLLAEAQKAWWEFWKHPDYNWVLTPNISLHIGTVISIRARTPRRKREPVGFHP